MKKIVVILLLLLFMVHLNAQNNSQPDFTWINGSYFNIDMNETIDFKGTKIKLLQLENHYNCFQINKDTLWLKVSRRTLPYISNGIRIYVADNVNLKNLSPEKEVHGLLQKDALICVGEISKGFVDPNKYTFPVSFNDGFIWNAGEDSHMFSYMVPGSCGNSETAYLHQGIDINLHDARGKEKHLVVAMEKCRVAWIKDKKLNEENMEASVLLQSESDPAIYYLYEQLYNKKVFIRKGQKLVRGEPIGAVWGDEVWGHLHVSVIRSKTEPTFENRYTNVINFFPQLYELYFNRTYSISRNFSKGRILFGQSRELNGNQKNIGGFESYYGKGWIWGKWNIAEKTEMVNDGVAGNARIRKVMFPGQKVACKNPKNYFQYEINVPNGTYRIRAKVGDLKLGSKQKIEFEGVNAFDQTLASGQLKWTNERIVKVKDGRLTVKIYIDETNQKVAGISEIVFQQAY